MTRSLCLVQHGVLLKTRRHLSSFATASSIEKTVPPLHHESPHPTKIFQCICEDESKLRLDSYLAKMVSSRTRSQIGQSIKNGFVKINDESCLKPSYSIKPGDSVYFELNRKTPSHIEPEDIPLDVVYEDEDIIVVNKEVGMVVHPSAGHWSGTLVHALMHHSNIDAIELNHSPKTFNSTNTFLDDEEAVFRPGIVHRLDRGTSGLLVVAKNDSVHATLSEKFKNREVSRKYLSIMIGRPKVVQNRIETNIDRDPRDRKLQRAIPASSRKGRNAISNYSVLELDRKECLSDTWSLVSWKLETGRTHQIRAHAKYLGCPIMGDLDYGGDLKLYLSKFKNRKTSKIVLEEMMNEFPTRPMLHSQTLAFNHPRTEEPLSFSTELPQDFQKCLKWLTMEK